MQNSICARWNFTVDTAGSDKEDEEDGDIPAQLDNEDDIFDWDKFDPGAGLSAWDRLGEGYEQDAARIGGFPHQLTYEIFIVNLEL